MALSSVKLEPWMRKKSRNGKPKHSNVYLKRMRHRLRRRYLKTGKIWNENFYNDYEY